MAILSFAAAGCDTGGKTSEGAGAQGSGGDGGSGGATTGANDAAAGATGEGGSVATDTGGNVPFSCTVEPSDEDGCGAEQVCPVTQSWLVRCPDSTFGSRGMQVASTSNAVYFGADAEVATRIWRLDDTGGRALTDFPLEFHSGPMAFAVAEDDTLYVLGDETLGVTDYTGGLELATVTGAEVAKRPVYINDEGYVDYYDLAVDPEGVPKVWLDYARLDDRLAQPGADGTWTLDPAPYPGSQDERFSLSDSGESVAFGMDSDLGGTTFQVMARLQGQDATLGSDIPMAGGGFPTTVQDTFPQPTYRPIDPPVPLDGARVDLDYAAIVQHQDSLRVAWASQGAPEEVTLPDTAPPVFQCSASLSDTWPPCPDLCHEQVEGLGYGAFAAARGTSDIWVAYLIQKVDWDVEQTTYDVDGETRCSGGIGGDRSTSELAVWRVPLDGSDPVSIASIPMGRLGLQMLTWFPTDRSPVAIHAFGDRVAVAARTETDTESEFHVFLLEP